MAAPSQRGHRSGVTGSTSGAAITVRGLRELRRELRQLDAQGGERKWTRELSRTHRLLGTFVAELAQARAAAMGGMHAHFAGDIRGRGTVTGARIGLRGGKAPDAAGAFWGSNSRSGWNLDRYLAHLIAASRGDTELNRQWSPQFPRWVGNTWDVGVAGTGPYAINDTIAANDALIVDQYAQMIDRLVTDAFPD